MTRGFHLTKNKQSPTALGDPILLGMKQEDAQLDANWGGIPSLIHHWMEALLRLAAMCLSNLASLLGMRVSRLPGECHTDATPQALPLEASDPSTKEIERAAPSSQSIEALILSSERSSRPSKDEGVLTAARHKPVATHQDCLDLPPRPTLRVKLQANAGTQGCRQGLSRIAAAARRRNKPFVPPFRRLTLSRRAAARRRAPERADSA
jgi:hypothetical protein